MVWLPNALDVERCISEKCLYFNLNEIITLKLNRMANKLKNRDETRKMSSHEFQTLQNTQRRLATFLRSDLEFRMG